MRRERQINESEWLMFLFAHSARMIGRGHHHPRSMSPGQTQILEILYGNDSMTQRELLEIVGTRSASLSELLGKMERYGLVERRKDEADRRNVIVALTEQGAALVKQHREEMHNRADDLFSALSTEEKKELISLLEKLMDSWNDSQEMRCGRQRVGRTDCRQRRERGPGRNGDRRGE